MPCTLLLWRVIFLQQDFAGESIEQIEVENDENKEVENADEPCNSHDVNINNTKC